jgi:hypothetical protein
LRVLADEHVPGSSIAAARAAGHVVAAVGEETPGAPDGALLARAVGEGCLLVTFDKGFGARIFKLREPAPAEGVILFRLERVEVEFVTAVLLRLLVGGPPSPAGQFTVVDEERIRQRVLPPRSARGGG